MFKDKNEKLISKLPFGFRDIFPVEQHERKSIEEIVRNIFINWGYGEIRTPVVEYTKNLSAGVGKNWKDKLISFFDNDGNLVSMRADMTVPVARLTGMRIKKEQLPVRFFYFANSFRQSGLQKGQKRVLNQAGLELIGSDEFIADIEVLIILITILERLGIKNFKLGLGHIMLIEGICEWFGLESSEYTVIRKNLISNNLVEIQNLLFQKDKKKVKLFMEIIKPSDNINKILKLIKDIENKKVASSFNYIKKVYDFLQNFGFDKYLITDLGTIRDFDYYSGLIFEVFCSGTSGSIGSGGRYDGLVEKFGFDVPATGFALDIDFIHKAIKDVKLERFRFEKAAIILNLQSDYSRVLDFASKLRSRGISAAIMKKNEIVANGPFRNKSLDYIYEINWNTKKVTRIDVKNNKREVKDLKEY